MLEREAAVHEGEEVARRLQRQLVAERGESHEQRLAAVSEAVEKSLWRGGNNGRGRGRGSGDVIEPSRITYNALITACAKSPNGTLALCHQGRPRFR